MLETRVDTSISVSVAVEAISGARLARSDESGWPLVPVLGAVGIVAVAWTGWTGVHSPVLVNPSAVGLWRAAIVAAYWAVGTYTWWRRPDSRLGPVVTGVGLVYAATSLAGSGASLVHTLGMVAWAACVVYTAYLYLCFPSGRLESQLERAFMSAIAIGTAVVWALLLALSPSLPAGGSFVNCGHRCPPNALQVLGGHAATGTALGTAVRILFAVSAIGVAMLLLTKVRSSGRLRRRAIAPLAAVFVASVIVFLIAQFLDPVSLGLNATLRITGGFLVIAIPFAILAGQVRGDVFAAISLGQVAVRAGGKPLTPAAVQELLGDALGDPSLRLVLWSAERRGFVDVDGATVRVPDEGSEHGVTWLTRSDQTVAALVHDPMLDADSTVLEGLAATSLMLLDNARLVDELRASRARIVDAGERERRRLERDLHDGAQQRLVALQIRLESARELADDAELIKRLDATQRDAEAALEEVRALAHGIYPAELHDLGLPYALRSLALRSPVPIHVADDGVGRASAAIEAAIYFCVREAIQNAAKHAGPGVAVTVTLARRADAIEFAVSDDGVGLAREAVPEGSGITGMRDRIEAAGGMLEIVSPTGRGTRVRGTVPLRHDHSDDTGTQRIHPERVTWARRRPLESMS
jgi:signal transduction histidine kinase